MELPTVHSRQEEVALQAVRLLSTSENVPEAAETECAICLRYLEAPNAAVRENFLKIPI